MKTYSYIRYSSDRQERGDSVRRQREVIAQYARQQGLEIEHEYLDAGVSAFRGKQLGDGSEYQRFKEGAEKPCKLIVERLDRLSRSEIRDALPEILGLNAAGVEVIIAESGRVLKGEMQDVMMTVLEAHVAHEEVKNRATKVKASWVGRLDKVKKKDVAKILKPSWIGNEERADVVREIFKLYLAGSGTDRIAQELTAQGIETFKGGVGSKWTSATVWNILTHKATIGSYVAHRWKSRQEKQDLTEEIAGYFKPVVSEEDFWKVQTILQQKKLTKVTRQGARFNVFQKVARCGWCGGSLHCLPKGRKSERYLVCSQKCEDSSYLRNDRAEDALKEILVKLPIESLFDRKVDKTEEMKLNAKLGSWRGKLEGQVAREFESAEYNEDLTNSIVNSRKKIKEFEAALKELKKEEIKEGAMGTKQELMDGLDFETQEGRKKVNEWLVSNEVRLDAKVTEFQVRVRGALVLVLRFLTDGMYVSPFSQDIGDKTDEQEGWEENVSLQWGRFATRTFFKVSG